MVSSLVPPYVSEFAEASQAGMPLNPLSSICTYFCLSQSDSDEPGPSKQLSHDLFDLNMFQALVYSIILPATNLLIGGPF